MDLECGDLSPLEKAPTSRSTPNLSSTLFYPTTIHRVSDRNRIDGCFAPHIVMVYL
jgi:hypothetical protein